MGEKRFNLIIDDGLHLPHANINMLHVLLPLLADDGAFVVEDINRFYPFWKIASVVLSTSHDTYFVQTKSAFVFVARPRKL